MGNACCDDGIRPKQSVGDISTQTNFNLKNSQLNQTLIRKYSALRSEVNLLPITNNKVEENIKKLSKLTQSNNKIWKIKQPYNIIYTNKDPQFENQLPKGYVKVYKLKQNGDFIGFYQGKIHDNFQPDLNESIFVYHNGSYFIGTGDCSGIYTNQNTNFKYQGQWLHQHPHGKGVQQCNTGVYRGLFHEGQKHGIGIFQWNNGATYEGQFQKGAFHGQGHLISQQKKYSYNGEYYQDLKHGLGIQNKQKQTYKGHFHKDKRCGFGKLTVYQDQDKTKINYVYQGTFQNNRPHGKGTYSQTNTGKKIQGIWDKGILIATN